MTCTACMWDVGGVSRSLQHPPFLGRNRWLWQPHTAVFMSARYHYDVMQLFVNSLTVRREVAHEGCSFTIPGLLTKNLGVAGTKWHLEVLNKCYACNCMYS